MKPGRSKQARAQESEEAAARVSFLKMTPRKWRLVRMFERVLKLFLPFLPRPLSQVNSSTRQKAVLVVEYWNLGDLAILVPFLRALRLTFPDSRISLLVNPSLLSFLEGRGIADELIPAEPPWAQHFNRWKKYNPFSRNWLSLFRLILGLRRRQFDFAFSGRMDVRDNLLLWLSGARRRVGYGFAGGGFLLTDCIEPDFSRLHRADVWLHLLDGFAQRRFEPAGGYYLDPSELASAESFLAAHGIPRDSLVVGIHPSARVPTRLWGHDRFADVARHVLGEPSVHVLWFAEPGERIAAPDLDRCHEVKLDFRSFVSVLSFCDLLICNDSGPMHVANLLNVPVVAVFGPQRPEWFGPRGPRDRIVIRPEFWCRPCFDYCQFDEPHCLRAVSPEDVIRAVNEFAAENWESQREPVAAVTKPAAIYVRK